MKTATHLIPLIIGVLIIAAVSGCGIGVTTSTINPRKIPELSKIPESPATHEAVPQATIQINGMACPFCTYNIQRQIQALKGVQSVDVSLEKGEASVTLSKQGAPTAEQLREAVESAGFTPGEVQMP